MFGSVPNAIPVNLIKHNLNGTEARSIYGLLF
jgi:hypothetical protein